MGILRGRKNIVSITDCVPIVLGANVEEGLTGASRWPRLDLASSVLIK
jgi:hypothetical protein